MDIKLADLKLKPYLLAELHQLGDETLDDLQRFTDAELLRIPGMGGRDWRTIARENGKRTYRAAPANAINVFPAELIPAADDFDRLDSF